jgi:DNA-binding NtrC family response regulator
MTRILVVEDDEIVRENVAELLEMEGFEVLQSADGPAGIQAALRHDPALIICDVTMPGMDGFQVFEVLSGHPATTAIPFIFLTARAERSDIRRGMALGADDFITKPFARVELMDSVAARLRRHRPGSHPPSSGARGEPSGRITADPIMERLVQELDLAARSSIPILLLGETGTGKEVLAKEVHRFSGRSGAFVPVNCAALAENLLESELFGHEKGAFTGATQARIGFFEAADGGTIFLDEVGELPLATQVKLLRVLEDKQIVRVGGRTPKTLDVRFVAATNRDLDRARLEGEFRSDLYYRLSALTLQVPPLRERPEDILAISEGFLQSSAAPGKTRVSLSQDVQAVLLAYAWPGNIRELRNVIERAVLLSQGGQIEVLHLPAGIRMPAAGVPTEHVRADARDGLLERLSRIERERIVEALERSAGNQTQAASLLGVSRRTLVSRLAQFDLPRPRKRPSSFP